VRTVSDTATTATNSTVARKWVPETVKKRGASRAVTMPKVVRIPVAVRQRGWAATSSPNGRTGSATCHEDSSAATVRRLVSPR
jgi:hypothetical protein